MSEQNPYAPPSVIAPVDPLGDESSIKLDDSDQKRVNAIIQDAGQFWMATILCIVCVVIGLPLMAAWYAMRLWQWNRLAEKYPKLLASNAPRKSIQAKFQAARWKMIAGLITVAVVFAGLVMSYIASGIHQR